MWATACVEFVSIKTHDSHSPHLSLPGINLIILDIKDKCFTVDLPFQPLDFLSANTCIDK